MTVKRQAYQVLSKNKLGKQDSRLLQGRSRDRRRVIKSQLEKL